MSHRVTEFQNIMPISNIPSVTQYGILSHTRVTALPHMDVSMEAVQDRRAHVVVPFGRRLHEYANLYFHARNPMMYARLSEVNDLCVLGVHVDILSIPGVILADINAASPIVKFMTPADLNKLNFNLIYAQDWNHADPIEKKRRKLAKCAEVLVPDVVPFAFVQKAYVVNDVARNRLMNNGFNKIIEVKPGLFFR